MPVCGTEPILGELILRSAILQPATVHHALEISMDVW
jgi:hypothetical protein